MLGKIFGVLVLAALGFGAANGRLAEVAQAAVDGGEKAVQISLALLGTMCLWSGVMRVAEAVGASRLLARILSGPMRILFPDAAKKGRGIEEISAAFSANLLGVGNAATPLAVRAMTVLGENRGAGTEASDDMVTFTVLGCACPSLFPTMLFALRSAADSADPFGILSPVWICSAVCTSVSMLLARGLRHLFRKKDGGEKP